MKMSGIKELTLNNGLKYIGNNAFKYNKLDYVKIPETVEIVGHRAFDYNSNLTGLRIYETLNKKTIVID